MFRVQGFSSDLKYLVLRYRLLGCVGISNFPVGVIRNTWAREGVTEACGWFFES